MATLRDKDNRSYVPSPTRGAEQYARAVVVENNSSSPLPIDIVRSDSALVTNLALAASTEVSHSFQTNVQQAIIRVRELVDMQFTFTSLESGTKYITLKAGCVLKLTELDFTGKILYAQTNANSTVEIMEFYY